MSEEQAYRSWIPESRSVQLWFLAVLGPAVILVVGSLVRPDIFYDRFIWKYFYGPIVADAQGVAQATHNGVVAEPGYTYVNEAGYAYTLIVGVFGVVKLLDRFDVGNSPSFFYGLVPYGFVGGAFRVVEDTGGFDWPLEFFFISPAIYFTMFFVTAGFFLISLYLEKSGATDNYAKPLAGFGFAWLFITLAYLFYFGATGQTTETGIQAELVLWLPVAVIGIATVLTVVFWFASKEFAPWVFKGTGLMGAVVVWGHLIDGSATGLGIETLGYSPKHPVVDFIYTTAGTAYAFIAVKALAALIIVSIFEEEAFEESPRFYYLLLITILVVGLGPGTRDLLRATIGV